MVKPDSSWKQNLRRRILVWFQRNSRDLPWRRTRDPYHVWVSEIMLQQTQVVTVIPYFERFIARFPTVAALAAAHEDQVLRLWEGLGYYRRARQLHRAARVIVDEHGGVFPRDAVSVMGLPGIGRYTAGAILSIAFDARAPILEANTIRVFSRLIAYRDDTASTDGQRVLWGAAQDFLPRKNVGDFNQAMMELGSEVCTPREPRCEACPVAILCPTRAQGLQDVIPAAKKKVNYEDVVEACIVVRKNGKVLLRRCEEGERWAGLWDFPRLASSSQTGAALHRELGDGVRELTGYDVAIGEQLKTIKHGVTRFRITLKCFEATHLSGRKKRGEFVWVRPNQLGAFALSVTGRQVAAAIQASALNGSYAGGGVGVATSPAFVIERPPEARRSTR
ncbi:MAG: A/G-specific adenine glycosylase [Planctomycetia bacterium]|nr:A/G-specific adenine glycosylase [Planctomycetia bacterium]